ncbi:translin-associated protein X-like [Clytia hemisphaerica]|uniref:translin-associated protein X-like n=1 Tax=Clytia hemisphaerica TaxID=252671 RepID=UPI0034D6099E
MNKKRESGSLDESSPLYTQFLLYQRELDTRNDKRERLVKLSRDVTIQSKRTIFTLLRKEFNKEKILLEGKSKIAEIKLLLDRINLELVNEDIHRFQRAFSPGIQEYVEAVSLYHYIDTGSVISYEETQQTFFDVENFSYFLTQMDYMLGIADLTGEMMRMSINAIGSGHFEIVESTCSTLQEIYSNFSIFSNSNRDLSRKLSVMKNSLQKVEKARCNLKVRGSEIPKHLLSMLLDETDEKIHTEE